MSESVGGDGKVSRRKFLVLSGPNLGRLGKREPDIYGRQTLADIHESVAKLGAELGVAVEGRQSNYEGELIDWLGRAEEEGFHGVLFNPGAYTHTSYALYDAIRGAGIPVVEVHISNPDAREPFRRRSRVAPACVGRVAGFGGASYALALRGLVAQLG